MKCEVCNAPITLEDEFCPYCGALNRPARKHLEDMKRYHMDYMNTKSEVLTNVGRQSRRHSQIIAIVLLVLLNVIVLAGHAFDYEVYELYQKSQLKRHAKEYEAQMSEYQAAGNYNDLSRIFTARNLYNGGEELRSYNVVCDMAMDYIRVTDGLFYGTHPEVKNYYDRNEHLNRVASAVARFYENYKNKDNSYRKEYYREDHLAAMEDMKVRMEAQLMTFGGLTEEEIAALPDRKAPEILMLLVSKEVAQ